MASKNFCGRTLARLSLLSLGLCLPLLWPQSGSEHLTVGQPKKVVGKRNDAVQSKIPVSVQEGFHVNSNTPSEDYLIPLKLTWTSLGALEGGQVSFPKPALEKFEFSDKPLSIYTGNIELTASFKVSAKAPAGPGMAVGKLMYQACSNKACYRPTTVEIDIPYQVQ
jgi:hypothetical protein